MTGEEFAELVKLLSENYDVFAWTRGDLVGISPKVVTYKLNVRPNAKPIKQKNRHFGTDKDKIKEEEV